VSNISELGDQTGLSEDRCTVGNIGQTLRNPIYLGNKSRLWENRGAVSNMGHRVGNPSQLREEWKS